MKAVPASVLVLFLVAAFDSHPTHATVLSKVTKIALASSPALEAKRMKALYASFSNMRPIWVQLWNRTARGSTYRLDWQLRVLPRYGDGRIEVLNLSVPEYVDIVPRIHTLAIMNERLPGPLNGHYSDIGDVLLSVRDRDYRGLPLNRSVIFQFDNLRLPYHLPITLCNQSGCPYELGLPISRPTHPPVKPAARPASRLLTDGMLTGLITWNIVLTLLLFLTFFILVFICADVEKRRREAARYMPGAGYGRRTGCGPGAGCDRCGYQCTMWRMGVVPYDDLHPGVLTMLHAESDPPSPGGRGFDKPASARF